MLQSFEKAKREYPSQFWLLFWGLLISTIGSSMIWPFLMIYVSKRLGLSLTAAASIMAYNSLAAIAFTFLAGPVTDKIGRKGVMVVSLLGNGLVYLLYLSASDYLQFSIAATLAGSFNPLFRVGADAMLADLIPESKRIDAYSLLRLSNNLGVAIGPIIGGFLAATSYSIAFYFAIGGMCTYGLLMLIAGKETIPTRQAVVAGQLQSAPHRALGGYLDIFRDVPYMLFILVFTLVQFCAAFVWILLSVYTNKQYGIPENQFGFLPTLNGLMIVFMQLWITGKTRHKPTFSMLALGSVFYGVATFSIAFMNDIWGFLISMFIMTIGEMILMPTSSTFVANMAPSDMRGRYMSFYTLTWAISTGAGSIIGGFLSDSFGPRSIWYGGGVIGLISLIGFIALQTLYKGQLKAAIPGGLISSESAEVSDL